ASRLDRREVSVRNTAQHVNPGLDMGRQSPNPFGGRPLARNDEAKLLPLAGEPLEGVHRDHESLALVQPPDDQHLGPRTQVPWFGGRPTGQIDAVRYHLVLASKAAACRPSRSCRYGDPVADPP